MNQTPSERRADGVAIAGEWIIRSAEGETKVYSEQEFLGQWIPTDQKPKSE